MKLWLDDMREPPDHTWTWAPNSSWAIVLLTHFPCEEVSFDFDLGTKIDGTKDTAQVVADWVEAQVEGNDMPVPRWSVHSSNPEGRKYITLTMQSCERIKNART